LISERNCVLPGPSGRKIKDVIALLAKQILSASKNARKPDIGKERRKEGKAVHRRDDRTQREIHANTRKIASRNTNRHLWVA